MSQLYQRSLLQDISEQVVVCQDAALPIVVMQVFLLQDNVLLIVVLLWSRLLCCRLLCSRLLCNSVVLLPAPLTLCAPLRLRPASMLILRSPPTPNLLPAGSNIYSSRLPLKKVAYSSSRRLTGSRTPAAAGRPAVGVERGRKQEVTASVWLRQQ